MDTGNCYRPFLLFDSIPGVISASFFIPRHPININKKQSHRGLPESSSTLLSRLFEQNSSPTLADTLEILRTRTFGLLLIFACFSWDLFEPRFFNWFNIEILSFVIIWRFFWGAIVILLAFQLICGRQKPWLPHWLTNRTLKGRTLRILEFCISWLERIESISRPRLMSLCKSLSGRIVIGLTIFILGVDLLPGIIDLTSLRIPGLGASSRIAVFVTGLGLLEDDGILCLFGLALCGFSLFVEATWMFGLL